MSPSPGRMYDVSRPLRDGGLIYPGDPEIRFRAHSSMARGDAANVSSLARGSHSGTHVDAPSHFVPDGDAVDRIPIGRLIGPAVVLEPAGTGHIGAAELAACDLQGQRRVLLRTRNSALAAAAGFSRDYCALAPDGAEYL